MSLVQNERTKLLATAISNLGVATVVTGLIAPTIALFNAANGPAPGQVILGSGCLVAGAVLHVIAQAILARLKP